MPRRSSKHPTELELEILKILWTAGQSTVRQIQEALAPGRGLAYTTVMTMLTIMANKGYVRRTKSGNGFVYRARIEQEKTSSGMLQDLTDRLFGGSTAAVVQHLLDTADLDPKELDHIRQLVARKRKEQKP
jgi:BlaI family transcriptional regulator, penicillinase repressor